MITNIRDMQDDELIERYYDAEQAVEECAFNLAHAQDLEWSNVRITAEEQQLEYRIILRDAYKAEHERRDNAMTADAERAANVAMLLAGLGDVETRFEAAARRVDDQDNAPARIGPEQ